MSGDYINRYAVLNTIDDAIAHNALSYEGCVNEIMEFIAKLPAADVRPVVRGHWNLQYDGDGLWHCSECGSKYIHTTNFCSNCGADMMGGGTKDA